jgi:hypothetical protein
MAMLISFTNFNKTFYKQLQLVEIKSESFTLWSVMVIKKYPRKHDPHCLILHE